MSDGGQARPIKRAILKLSGEALREPGSKDNISPEIVERIAGEICAAVKKGVELGSWWAVAISGEAPVPVPGGWTDRPPITWECSPR